MEFRVLGPVEVWSAGDRVDAGHVKQRAVLAVLLLDLGKVVPIDVLVDRVWGEGPPASVRNNLYAYVARLRAVIARADDASVVLARRPGGYLLQADPDQVDLYRFRHRVRQAAGAGDQRAAELLGEALGLWRGPALTGLASPWLASMRDTLEQQRVAAVLDRGDILLRQGQHAALSSTLAEQAVASPANEKLIGQLMTALCRSGRPAEALRWFEQTRRHLAEELGADPGPELKTLHQQILRNDPALAGPAPGDRVGAPVPRELPADVRAFTGRLAELAELDRLLDGSAAEPAAVVISAVSGTAGVGKTALAVHWAHHVAPRFPDGQLYLNLRGYDPGQPVTAADALAGFLRSLGLPGKDIPADTAERAARYRSLTSGRRMLVLLDNASEVEQVRPLLPGTATCVAVVTSRDSLAGLAARDGARRFDLDLLPQADAVDLLRALIGPRVDADPAAAAELTARCARLPLALRVAAELAASRAETPLADLATELAHDQRRLDLLDAHGDPRTAVRAVFSWSYRHLPPAAARAFRLAGLHPGPDLEPCAVAALAGTSVEQARQVMDELARAHLIQPAAYGRYGVHDLLRVYARELAASCDGAQEQRAPLTRLFDYYLSSAAAAMDILAPAETHRRPRIRPTAAVVPAMPGETEARAWLERERANLVAAVVHGAGHGWPRHATGLAGTLFRYLMTGSHLPEAQTIYSHALEAARRSGDPADEAEALKGLGSIGIMKGQYRDAADHYQAALERYRQCGNRAGQARVLRDLGQIEYQLHNLRSAASHCGEAVAAFDDAGDSLGVARVLVTLAGVQTELGSHDQASRHLQLALPVLREARDQAGEAEALDRLGELNLRRGQLMQAAACYGQALAICRRIDHPTGVANGLLNLGEVSLRQGQYRQAISYLRQALAMDREAGNQYGEIMTLRSLAEALHGAGQLAAARAELATALRLAAETGSTYQQASAHRDLAESHHSAGQHEQAHHHWQQALTLYTQLGAPEADQVRTVADPDHARAHWRQALVLYTTLGAPEANRVRAELSKLDGPGDEDTTGELGAPEADQIRAQLAVADGGAAAVEAAPPRDS